MKTEEVMLKTLALAQSQLSNYKRIVELNSVVTPDCITCAEWKRKYEQAHKELLLIHNISMCVAECPPAAPYDDYCVAFVKHLVQRVHTAEKALNAIKENVK